MNKMKKEFKETETRDLLYFGYFMDILYMEPIF
jgi:hypothetical protein